jgi:mRNA-degrading endonuclease HigB of HigAB toxin-antitoxin module
MIATTEKKVSKLNPSCTDWVIFDKWYKAIEATGNVQEAITWLFEHADRALWTTPEEIRREIGQKGYTIVANRWKIYHNPEAAAKYRQA